MEKCPPGPKNNIITVVKDDMQLLSKICKLGSAHKALVKRIVDCNTLEKYIVEQLLADTTTPAVLDLILEIILCGTAKQGLIREILSLNCHERELIKQYVFLPVAQKNNIFNFMQWCLMGERLGILTCSADRESTKEEWTIGQVRDLFSEFVSRANASPIKTVKETKQGDNKKRNTAVPSCDNYVSILRTDVIDKHKNNTNSETKETAVADLLCHDELLCSSNDSAPDVSQNSPPIGMDAVSQPTSLKTPEKINFGKVHWANPKKMQDAFLNTITKESISGDSLKRFVGPKGSKSGDSLKEHTGPKIYESENKSLSQGTETMLPGNDLRVNEENLSIPEERRNVQDIKEIQRPSSEQEIEQDGAQKEKARDRNLLESLQKQIDEKLQEIKDIEDQRKEVVTTDEFVRRGKTMSDIAASMSAFLHVEELDRVSTLLLKKAKLFCKEAMAIYKLFKKYLNAIQTPEDMINNKSKYTRLSKCAIQVLHNIYKFESELGAKGVKELKNVIKTMTVLMDVIAAAIAIVTDQVKTETNDGHFSSRYCTVMMTDVSPLLKGKTTVHLNDLKSSEVSLKGTSRKSARRRRQTGQKNEEQAAKKRKLCTGDTHENHETDQCSTVDDKDPLNTKPTPFLFVESIENTNQSLEDDSKPQARVPEIITFQPVEIFLKDEVIEVEQDKNSTVVTTCNKSNHTSGVSQHWQEQIHCQY